MKPEKKYLYMVQNLVQKIMKQLNVLKKNLKEVNATISKKFSKNLETYTQTAKYIIKFSPSAKADFRTIYDYLFWRLSSPINANRFREKFYSKLEILKYNPYIYSILTDYSNLNYEYRKSQLIIM